MRNVRGMETPDLLIDRGRSQRDDLAITFGSHVPLSEQIDLVASSAGAAELADAREQFEAPWVIGSVVRTFVCIAALAALTRSLLLHGSERRPASSDVA